MPKPRSKRKDIREEKKRKRETDDGAGERPHEAQARQPKRPRNDEDFEAEQPGVAGDPQFFGVLTDEEQEKFHNLADELEGLMATRDNESIDQLVTEALNYAESKELKLACSQGGSKFMERLIILSTTAQKKVLFQAFACHFLALMQHRFASHVCEALFLSSAAVVAEEQAGSRLYKRAIPKSTAERENDEAMAEDEDIAGNEDDIVEQSMEQLILLTLDELENDLGFLITQTFASHSLRILLVVLSGKPLSDQHLLQVVQSSKSKKQVAIPQRPAVAKFLQEWREVPKSFHDAIKKIISDSVALMDHSSLRILATHHTGNPTLQLLLECDLYYKQQANLGEWEPVILKKLLPGAPESLLEDVSQATEFITAMVFDPIGSRLLEVLIEHCPGKYFQPINEHIFLNKIASYAMNGTACYPLLKLLARVSQRGLMDCVEKLVPVMPALIERERYTLVKTLFERCKVRECDREIQLLRVAVVDACGGDPKNLIPKFCHLRDQEAEDAIQAPEEFSHKKNVVINHGANLISTMLQTPGPPAKAAQTSLLNLSQAELLSVATKCVATSIIIQTALTEKSLNPLFHKSLVASLVPVAGRLAMSECGKVVVSMIMDMPTRGDRSIPFHMKEAVMGQLVQVEGLETQSAGRWTRSHCRVATWRENRTDWTKWRKEKDAQICGDEVKHAAVPAPRDDWESRRRKEPNPSAKFVERRKAEKERKIAKRMAAEAAAKENGGDISGDGEQGEDAGEMMDVDVPAAAASVVAKDKRTKEKRTKDKSEVIMNADTEKLEIDPVAADDGLSKERRKKDKKDRKGRKAVNSDGPEASSGLLMKVGPSSTDGDSTKEERRKARKEKKEKKHKREKKHKKPAIE